jgi:ubiquinol-cytochrome c reductase cytochrome b subunit
MLKSRWSKNFLLGFLKSHAIDYPTPINLSYMWSFGFLATMCLVWQILTGIFLAMHYVPEAPTAFYCVEHIMREVNSGWFLRYGHANGASMFFIVVYIHIFRGLYYMSYLKPRETLWVSGILIFLAMMATAFLGYVLPWGQMSYWGATVITNLFSSIPAIGESIVEWLWGGFSVETPTLNRFFSIHYTLPFVIAGLVFVHLTLLHKAGSTNPAGVLDQVSFVPFYPYYIIKDLFSFIVFSFFFGFIIFYYPNLLGHPDNYVIASSSSTPEHIVPEWYFLPFYAILRTVPSKLGGILLMFGAIVALLILPFIHKETVPSVENRLIYLVLYWFLFFDFIILGWIGQKEVEFPFDFIGTVAATYYFAYFLVILPNLKRIEILITSIPAKIPFNSIKTEYFDIHF